VLFFRSEANLRRALAAEQTAVREAETAQRTSDFLVELFDQADPLQTGGRDITAREVVDEGARRLGQSLEGEPVLKARLLGVIAKVYKSLGLFDDALVLASEARNLRQEHLPAGDLALADIDALLGSILDSTGDRDGAAVAYERALAVYEAQGPAGHPGLIQAEGDRAWMLGSMGNFAAAHSAISRALTLAEAQEPRNESRVTRLLSNQGAILMNEGATDSALNVLNRALVTARRIEDKEMAATILTNLGVAHAMAGQPDQSTQPYREALDLYRQFYGENHPQVARALGNVGINFAQRGLMDEAMPYMQQTVDAQIAIFGEDSPMLGQAYMNLGLTQLNTGDPTAAERTLQRAVDLNERAAADGKSISLSMALYHLASAKATLGNYAAARPLMLRVLAMDKEIFGEDSEDVAGDLEEMALLERADGNEEEAERLEKRARGIREKLSNR